MFYGESSHTMDAKNRIFVPKRLQEGLDRGPDGHLTVILTRGFEGCLFLFSESGFAEVLQRLSTQAFEGAERRRMQRLFFANTHRGQLDASGRVLIPDKLRQVAGIEKEVVLIGCVDRVEIWAGDRWNEFESANADDFDALDSVLLRDPPSTNGHPASGADA